MKRISIAAAMLLFGLLTACGTQAASTPVSVPEPTVEAEAPSPIPTPEPETPAETPQEPAPEASILEEPEASVLEEPSEPAAEPEGPIDPETFFTDYLTEPSVEEMYQEVADQFQVLEYSDPDTGLTISYNLFVPAQAETEPCPMVMFIADSSVVGRDVAAPLYQGYGGIIWATASEQEKHPAYVLVPQYPEIIIDDNRGVTVTDYVEATARMVEAVASENNVDTDRIYATGQSMGCMTSLYLAAHHPDLFAAELFVSGQWQMDELQGLETQTFCYIAAGGDMKASAGQVDVMADLDSKGVDYSVSYDWDATQDDAAMEPMLRELLAQETAIHIGQFAAGTVTAANPKGMEHMASFDCAYKLDALRNWLFAQSK